MNQLQLPILYSFRRCPYAMRARLVIAISEVQVETREVDLSNKPGELLTCSSKATVPVLQLQDNTIIDESYDIMLWALKQHDPKKWLPKNSYDLGETNNLVNINDNEFKLHLDKYKYASRFPEESMSTYRKQGEDFLRQLESTLQNNTYLIGDAITLADMAVLPFVRQFAYVDKEWFDQSQYVKLQFWLKDLLNTSLFKNIMIKHPVWKASGLSEQSCCN